VKLHLVAVGRLKEPYLVAAAEEYVKRLRPMCTLVVQEVKDDAALLAAIPANAHLYAFDERGEMVTSAQLADLIAAEQAHGGGAPVAFAIGGADGHSDAVRKRAKKLLAFGRMTIAHRLVRILVLEQIYRSFKILRGEPYHRD
jgi:23S rRNA (pseudouridine1915-N3)-methyltransferase